MFTLKKISSIIAVAIVVISIVMMLPLSDDVRIIKKNIMKACKAIEHEDIDELMSVVALSYRDDAGLAYVPLRRIFADLFAQLDGIQVRCDITQVDIRSDSADAILEVSATGSVEGTRYQLAGTRHDPEHMTLLLVKTGLAWKIISSQRQGPPSIERLLGAWEQ